MLASIILGIIVGVLTTVDYCRNTRRRLLTKMVVSGISLSGASYSLIKSSFFSSTPAALSTAITNYPAFLLSFVMAAAIVMTVVYCTVYRKWRKAAAANPYPMTFLDLIDLGFKDFKKTMIEFVSKSDRALAAPGPTFNLYETNNSFMHKLNIITMASPDSLEAEGFIMYTLYAVLQHYFEEGEASFTLRGYSKESNSMVTKYTTRKGDEPGEIPLDHKSLIQLSLDCRNTPVIYSLAKEYHFVTLNGGVEKGIYDDYVSLCIVSEQNKPLYSLCLEVKGEQARNRMFELVFSGNLSQVGLAIAEKCRNIAVEFLFQSNVRNKIKK